MTDEDQVAEAIYCEGNDCDCDLFDCHRCSPVLHCSDHEKCREYTSEVGAVECFTCGCSERISNGKCSWCRVERDGRPWGSCTLCWGAKDRDDSCACKPPKSRRETR